MKKIAILLSFAGLVIFFFGCKKRNIVEYDLTYSSDFVFSALTVTPGLNNIYTTGGVITNISSSFDSHKLNSNIVGDIRCTAFNIKLKNPGTEDLSVMKNYEFFMSAGHQKEVRVSHCEPWLSGVVTTQTVINSGPISGTTTPVRIKIDSTNLKNYFIEPLINFKMKVWPTNTLSTSYTVNASYTVHVKAID